MWKLEFWKLEIKFGNRSFENLFEGGVLKIKFGIVKIWKIKFKNLNLGRLNLKLEF